MTMKKATRLVAVLLACLTLFQLCACSESLYASPQDNFTWQIISSKYTTAKTLDSTAGQLRYDSTRTTEDAHAEAPEGYTWVIVNFKLTKVKAGLKKFIWDDLKLECGSGDSKVSYTRLMTDYEFISDFNKYKPYGYTDFVAGDFSGVIVFEVKDEDVNGALTLTYYDADEGENIHELKK